MHKRLGLLCVIMFLLATLPVQAGERVKIAASKEGEYDLDNQVFVGRGDVVVTKGDLVLQGQELLVDLISGEVQMKGDVSITQDGQTIRGDTLKFNLETGLGDLDQPLTEIALPKETGLIYLAGESVAVTTEGYTLANATFTTCDLPNSHYHLATKELEIVLGEKAIIRGVTFYEGKIPILYWPYLVIPLDTDEVERFFTLPVFGFGEREGYFMKNTFNYYFNSRSRGNIYFDLFTRLGVGLGVRHNYDFKKLGNGSVEIYGLPSQLNTENSLTRLGWEHELAREKWRLTTKTARVEEWGRVKFTSDNRFLFSQPKLTAETWYLAKNEPQARTRESREYGGRWNQRLTDRLGMNLRINRTELKEMERDLKLLDYLAEATYRQGKHSVAFAVQQRHNPDLLTSTPPWGRVQKIPELKWEVSDLGFKKVPLRSQVILGRYEERPSGYRDDRYLGQLTLRPKSFSPLNKLSLTLQGDANYSRYGNGQEQTWLLGQAALNYRATRELSFSSTYRRRDVWGETPFSFDRQRAEESVTLRLSYNRLKIRASLDTKYDLKTQSFNDLILRSNLKPNEKWNLDLYANYDLNKLELLRVVPLVHYKSGDLDVRLGGRYLVKSNQWEQVDARITLPVGKTWLVSYDAIYQPYREQFRSGQISIVKDLHCRTISASYDHVNNRFALQYTINAFPTLPLGWDSEEGLGLFDLEDVTDIIGGME